jgi:hypothetical protein
MIVTSACVALGVLGACSGDQTVAAPPKAPIGSLDPIPTAPDAGADALTAKERALPELYAKALASASDAGSPFAQIVPLLNPELVQFQSPGMRAAHEPSGVVDAHGALFGAFDDRKVALTRVWSTAGEQSLEWTMTGTHAREWKGIAPTKKPVAFKGITLIWTKDDGSIVDIHVYFDVALVKAQLTGTGPKELVAATAPAAPTGAAQVFEQMQNGAIPENKGKVDAVRSWLDALENHNEAAYAAAMTDDIEINTLERAQPVKGNADAKAYYKTMHRSIRQLDTSILNAWGVGDFAIVEYEIGGEQVGPIAWITSQRDEVIRWQIVDICQIQNGKVARVWRYDNPLQLVVPPAPPPEKVK